MQQHLSLAYYLNNERFRQAQAWRKFFRQGNVMRFYCERQHDVSDCASASLVSIARYYGHHIQVAKVRELAETDLNGTNVNGILKAADKIGFEGNAVKCNKAALFSGLKLPCMAHVTVNDSLNHFVVIYKITKKYIWIADPARGNVRLKPEDFCGESKRKIHGVAYHWTGILILLEKKDTFEKKKGTTRKFFFHLMKQEKALLFKIILFSVLYTILGICGSVYYKILIDTILPAHMKTRLTMVTVGIVFVYLLKFILNLVRTRGIVHLGKRLDDKLFSDYIEHMLHLPMSFFENRKVGDIISRFQDADKIKNAISSVVIVGVLDGVLVLIGLVILACVNLSMFWIAGVIIVVYAGLAYLFSEKFEFYNHMWMEYNSKLSAGLIEGVTGIQTVKAYNMEQKLKERSKEQTRDLLDCGFRYHNLIYLQSALEELIELLCGTAVLWVGSVHVMDGTMTVGQLMLYYSLFVYFLGPIKNIINVQPQMQTAVVAANRLVEIMELLKEDAYEKGEQAVSLTGDILFDKVSFGYRSGKLIVKNISLTIKQGEKIAVIGTNGSGKSTLFKLLMKYYPIKEGTITIGGKNIGEIDTKYLRKRIGYVNQETFFLAETIYENLINGNRTIPDEKVLEICKLAKVHDFVMELPFQYQTKLEENAMNLSSGQRQRLALARVLLKDPDIFVLDEFTSNIDAETEADLIDLIYTYCQNKTVIFITHKMQAIERCDKVYRMEQGEINLVERE